MIPAVQAAGAGTLGRHGRHDAAAVLWERHDRDPCRRHGRGL